MASNGLLNKAKKGTCRICQRTRNTAEQLKAVGEVRHGFATGHIWECRDANNCDKVAYEKLSLNISNVIKFKIKIALQRGRFTEYTVIV